MNRKVVYIIAGFEDTTHNWPFNQKGKKWTNVFLMCENSALA